jgi:hypothetical protein
VHSFDLFSDPDEVALRIARTLGYEGGHEEPEKVEFSAL